MNVTDLFGGVRGTVFAACAAVLLVVAGVATGVAVWRGNTIERLQAEAREWKGAQDTNLKTIADLKTRNYDLVKAWTWDQGQAREAAERAADANKKTNEQLAATQAKLGEIYARNPSARAWGAAAVDPAIADRLPRGGAH